MSDRPTFTVLQGDSEPIEVGSLIPDHTAGYLVHTFGELFADIAWQVRRNTDNERAALLHRLNDCAQAYGHIPLPDEEGAGPTNVDDVPAPSVGADPEDEVGREAREDAEDWKHHDGFIPKLPGGTS